MKNTDFFFRFGFLGWMLIAGSEAFSQSDQVNLEEGFGATVEDAYPTSYLNREIQLFSRYDLKAENKNEIQFNPAIEFGMFRNAGVELSVPVILGNGSRATSGDIRLGALYNFNAESLLMPAFAFAGKVILPTGIESRGLDYSTKGIITKTISRRSDRLHLNFEYIANQEPRSEPANGSIQPERHARFKWAIGYSGRVGNADVMVINYVYEELRLITKISQIAEVGWRRQLAPRTIISAGAGIGLSKDAPDFNFRLGLQRNI